MGITVNPEPIERMPNNAVIKQELKLKLTTDAKIEHLFDYWYLYFTS